MFTNVVEQYVEHEREEKRLAKTTLSNYRAALRRFARTLPPNTTLGAVTPAMIRRYMLGYSDSHESASVHQVASALRSLSRYLQDQGFWLDDPCEKLPLPKKGPSHPHLITDAEVAALWEACDRIAGERYRLRAKAVFAILIYGGLRRQELIDLKLGDINLREKRLEVRHGKGDRARVIYLEETAVLAIRDWLRIRPKEAPHDYLFTANNRFKGGVGMLKRIFAQVWAIAGYKETRGVWCHAFRHACATRMIRNGATIPDVQAFLGHRDMHTTLVYLHTDETRLRDMARFTTMTPASQETPSRKDRIGLKLTRIPTKKAI